MLGFTANTNITALTVGKSQDSPTSLLFSFLCELNFSLFPHSSAICLMSDNILLT